MTTEDVTLPSRELTADPVGRPQPLWTRSQRFVRFGEDVAWAVLAVLLVITLFAWRLAADHANSRANERFRHETDAATQAIAKRMAEYERALRGGVRLLTAAREVSQEEWAGYVAALELGKHFPGVEGIDFLRMPSARTASEGGERPLASLEAFTGQNLSSFGDEREAAAVRQAAMDEARDAGLPAVSGRVTRGGVHGILIYLPVYQRGLPTRSVAERRAALRGFVFSPVRVAELMYGVYGSSDASLALQVFDGSSTDPAALLYDNTVVSLPSGRPHHAAYVATEPLELPGGRMWTLRYMSRPSFEAQVASSQPWLIALGGIAIDLLLFGIIFTLVRQRSQAVKLANAMTVELRASTERFRGVVEAAPNAIVMADRSGRITLVNTEAERLFGYRREELLGHGIELLLPDGFRDAHAELHAAFTADPKAVAIRAGRELYGRRKDGTEVPVEISLNLIETPEGMQVLASMTDIFERKVREYFMRETNTRLAAEVSERERVEASLRASEARLRTFFDHVTEGIALFDANDRLIQCNEKYRLMNDDIARLLVPGATYEELARAVANVMVTSGTLNAADAFVAQRLTMHREPAGGSGERPRMDGGVSLIREARTAAGETVVTHLDITQLKRREEELAHTNEALARANADLEQFAYAASHDLKAPLRAIDHLASWIAEDLGSEVPSAVARNIDRLRKRVFRLEKLIDDLLAYSRAGRKPADAERVDTQACIQGIVDDLALPPGFTVQVSGDAPSLLTARAPLETVLRNLIQNAVKHHDRKAGHVEISTRPNGRHFTFTVADDGPGIAPEYHERIFEPFERLAAASDVGSGLGLALVKRLVENCGGRIAVHSEEGSRGTTFEFDWPMTWTGGTTHATTEIGIDLGRR